MTNESKLLNLKELRKVVNSRNVNIDNWRTYAYSDLKLMFRNDDSNNWIPEFGTLDTSDKAKFAAKATEILSKFINKLEPQNEEDTPIYFD